ncbi:hypothetical protein D8B26_004848 [Coccidioides posadasii str. Silveira]|uniref:uncharacterized protein n=1 Tax=Coccidioides posadasii (strain RMSCC 757 / Silveira) TaxID=443226 RepID=UPI001BF07A89|nr:hypothetical protein D8B26_004848 [Coccidioides posadasii str. Silveira]
MHLHNGVLKPGAAQNLGTNAPAASSSDAIPWLAVKQHQPKRSVAAMVLPPIPSHDHIQQPTFHLSPPH